MNDRDGRKGHLAAPSPKAMLQPQDSGGERVQGFSPMNSMSGEEIHPSGNQEAAGIQRSCPKERGCCAKLQWLVFQVPGLRHAKRLSVFLLFSLPLFLLSLVFFTAP